MKNDTTENSNSRQDRLQEAVVALLAPLGYELVHIELHMQRHKMLRVFIDHLDPSAGGIGLEDCVKATRALDEPLDQIPEVEAIFKGAYELEVSSPGIDRPLRTEKDYLRFSGREARIHVFRPLTADELGSSDYQSRNPKQKNFLGTLKGVREGRVLLAPSAPSESRGKGAKGAKGTKKTKAAADGGAPASGGPEITIPIPLISKANLEPKFEILDKGETQ